MAVAGNRVAGDKRMVVLDVKETAVDAGTPPVALLVPNVYRQRPGDFSLQAVSPPARCEVFGHHQLLASAAIGLAVVRADVGIGAPPNQSSNGDGV